MKEPTSYELAILMALQRKPIYMGTVSDDEIARRRKAGLVAKATRKRNR